MLARSRLRDNARFPQPPCQKYLGERVVYLMGPRVAEVFTLEIDPEHAQIIGQALRQIQRRGPAHEFSQVTGEFFVIRRIVPGLLIRLLEFIEGGHEGFRDIAPPESTEPSLGDQLAHLLISSSSDIAARAF